MELAHHLTEGWSAPVKAVTCNRSQTLVIEIVLAARLFRMTALSNIVQIMEVVSL
jgi:hypothetical protein